MKETESDRIYEAMDTLHTIICSNCGKNGYVHDIDDWWAVEDFKNRGWRATKHGNVYCPDCAKKKLKARK